MSDQTGNIPGVNPPPQPRRAMDETTVNTGSMPAVAVPPLPPVPPLVPPIQPPVPPFGAMDMPAVTAPMPPITVPLVEPPLAPPVPTYYQPVQSYQPPVPPVEPPVQYYEPPAPPVQPPAPYDWPPAPPVEPPVQYYEPPVPPVQPPAPYDWPSAPPVEPPVPYYQAPVAPVEQPAPPVQLPVAPVEPPVAYYEPPVAPVEPSAPPVEPSAPPVEPSAPSSFVADDEFDVAAEDTASLPVDDTSSDEAFDQWFDPSPRIGGEISAERDEPPTRRRSVVAFAAVGLMVASLAALVVILLQMNVLSTGLLITVTVVEAVLIGGLALLLLTSRIAARQTRYVFGIVISVLLIIINSTLAWVGHGFNQMVANIQAPVEDSVLYDIVGLTAGPSLTELAGTQMGFDGTDPNQDAVFQGVKNLAGSVVFVDSPDWSTAVNDLLLGQYPSVVIQDGYMQIFADADPDDYANVTVLGTFEVAGTANSPGGTFTPLPPSGADQPFIVYISGIDTSGAITNRSRSDVNQLMVVNPKTGQVLLVSTPRDFYVTLADMPNCDLPDKLTHSGVYGIGVSVDTINALYGININYYVRLNFSSLVTLVDALGGIDVNSPVAFTATEGACDGFDACPSFTKGMNHMDGKLALAFSRERHNVPGGDRGRGTDQQAVITAILKKATQPSSLLNYGSIISAVSGSIQTSMTPDQISAQVKQQISSGTSWTVKSMSVTGADSSQYTCSYPHQQLYVMIPDMQTVNQAKQAIQDVLNGN